MNQHTARKLAQQAIESLAVVGDWEPVGGSVVIMTRARHYSVTDNGEEVKDLTAEQAIEIIVENILTE